MGDIVMFRSRGQRALDALDTETRKVVDRIASFMEREVVRRTAVYGDPLTPESERVLALYPMFRLTHANRARRCLYCNHRIAPLELHFVSGGSYICQSGTCMDSGVIAAGGE